MQDALANIDGVSDVKVSMEDSNAVMKIDAAKVKIADLTKAVSEAGPPDFTATKATN